MRPAAALALCAALAGCSVLDPMMAQRKVKAYARSRFYADGRAMRRPPPGTVPAGGEADASVETGQGPDGKPLATVPLPVTPALLALGRARFEAICAACHGLLGDGDSAVARNMSLRPPPSLHPRIFPEGYTYRIISEGFGLMPSYASALDPRERWAVVAYLRALRLAAAAPLGDASPEARRRLEEGLP